MLRDLIEKVDYMKEETNNVSGDMETIWWIGERITEFEAMSAETSRLKWRGRERERLVFELYIISDNLGIGKIKGKGLV